MKLLWNLILNVVVVAHPSGVEKPTLSRIPTHLPTFYRIRISSGKFSPTQPSNASRRHPNKQEDEKGWHGGERIDMRLAHEVKGICSFT
ncbi:hypothetical protein TNIN_391741 [Trichonephila inaurata madagascariensis]|uniref:Secreted protein n=1 Tax=Trichonephila inaurata madagascariensis TaxID=2747483 RepID=A0A8X6YIT6_9ARAC|nr:hypothetical protein TNIN_391741 [Trichonephila inaurata madagascariensis]